MKGWLLVANVWRLCGRVDIFLIIFIYTNTSLAGKDAGMSIPRLCSPTPSDECDDVLEYMQNEWNVYCQKKPSRRHFPHFLFYFHTLFSSVNFIFAFSLGVLIRTVYVHICCIPYFLAISVFTYIQCMEEGWLWFGNGWLYINIHSFFPILFCLTLLLYYFEFHNILYNISNEWMRIIQNCYTNAWLRL